jgi:hypothetical protein
MTQKSVKNKEIFSKNLAYYMNKKELIEIPFVLI